MDDTTAAGSIAGAVAAGKWGDRLLVWFWKLLKKGVKQSLESGDSSESIETKTPFQKREEQFDLQKILTKIFDAIEDNTRANREMASAVKNLSMRFDMMDEKRWDGHTERRTN